MLCTYSWCQVTLEHQALVFGMSPMGRMPTHNVGYITAEVLCVLAISLLHWNKFPLQKVTAERKFYYNKLLALSLTPMKPNMW